MRDRTEIDASSEIVKEVRLERRQLHYKTRRVGKVRHTMTLVRSPSGVRLHLFKCTAVASTVHLTLDLHYNTDGIQSKYLRSIPLKILALVGNVGLLADPLITCGAFWL